VIVNDAKVGSEANYGGLVAAPVFSRIGGKAARYLDIQPEAAIAMAQSGNADTASSTAKIR
jgi:hypothetical protein